MFYLLFIAIYCLLHFYVYYRTAIGLSLNVTQKIVTALILTCGAASFLIERTHSGRFVSFLFSYLSATWFGIISIAVPLLFISQILSAIFRKQLRIMTAGALIAVVLLTLFSIYHASLEPRLKEIRISLNNLPAHLKGFTIVQISDLHLDNLKREKWLWSIVNRINAIHPDMVVITGDLIDRNFQENSAEILKELKTQYGLFGITGNHEFYAGIEKFSDFCAKAGIKVLRNERALVAGAIQVAGVDDDAAKRFAGGGADLEKALEGADRNKPIILLSHKPLYYDRAEKLGVNLELSGHVHAGQIPPYNIIVRFIFKYPYGLAHHGSMNIYTTSGTGYWGPPMRLFSDCEIVKFVLE